ncbi:MAG: hypothetical protein PHI97_31055 [Desulfobulbus sp.]|nr:hypothetical protein [Desulfobulbus sp.]
MNTEPGTEATGLETAQPLGDSGDICDSLENVKSVVTFLAEMTYFGVFSGKDSIKISSEGEDGLHHILRGVVREIDEVATKVSRAEEIQQWPINLRRQKAQ